MPASNFIASFFCFYFARSDTSSTLAAYVINLVNIATHFVQILSVGSAFVTSSWKMPFWSFSCCRVQAEKVFNKALASLISKKGVGNSPQIEKTSSKSGQRILNDTPEAAPFNSGDLDLVQVLTCSLRVSLFLFLICIIPLHRVLQGTWTRRHPPQHLITCQKELRNPD